MCHLPQEAPLARSQHSGGQRHILRVQSYAIDETFLNHAGEVCVVWVAKGAMNESGLLATAPFLGGHMFLVVGGCQGKKPAEDAKAPFISKMSASFSRSARNPFGVILRAQPSSLSCP